MLALQNETESAMAEFLGNIKGHLSIGGSTIPGGYLLPRIIGRFTQAHPQVKISLILGDTSDIIDCVLDGSIEAGVVGARSNFKQLQQDAIAQDNLCLAVPADHRWAQRKEITFRELCSEPFILRESGSGTLRSLAEKLRQKGHDIEALNVVAEMGSTEAVRQGIKGGVGVSVISAIAIGDDVSAGLLRTLAVKGLNLKRSFYLTTHKQRSVAPLCRSFIDFLQKEIGAPP